MKTSVSLMLLMAGLLCSTTAMADSLPAVNVPERNKVTLVADSAIADKQSFDDSSGNGVQERRKEDEVPQTERNVLQTDSGTGGI